jgi:hypothetical protein
VIFHVYPWAPPEGFGPEREGRWLVLTVPTATDVSSRVEAEWQTALFTGAMRRRARSNGLPDILGETYRLVAPNGEVVDASFVVGRELPMTVRPKREDLVSMLERAVERASVRLDRMWFLQPDHLAPANRVVTDDAIEFVCDSNRRLIELTRDFVDPQNSVGIEGIYVDVREESGASVMAVGFVNSQSSADTRIREDLFPYYPPRAFSPEARQRYEELCRRPAP